MGGGGGNLYSAFCHAGNTFGHTQTLFINPCYKRFIPADWKQGYNLDALNC